MSYVGLVGPAERCAFYWEDEINCAAVRDCAAVASSGRFRLGPLADISYLSPGQVATPSLRWVPSSI